MENNEIKDDEEIEIDFSKIKNIFKKKKKEDEKETSSEIGEFEKEIKEDIKEEGIKIKELKEAEFESQEKIEKLETQFFAVSTLVTPRERCTSGIFLI